MKKTKRLTQRLTALCLAVILTVMSMPLTAMASTGWSAKVGDDVDITAEFNYGHEIHWANVDGNKYPLFCVDKDKKSPDYAEVNGFYGKLSSREREAAEWIYYGYFMEHGWTVNKLDMAYCQKKVWDCTNPEKPNTGWTFSSDGYDAWVANAENNKANLTKRPSFDNKYVGKIVAGKSLTVTDTNKVLKDYPAFTYKKDGVTITHEENKNTLKITVDKDCTATSFELPKGEYYKINTGTPESACIRIKPKAGVTTNGGTQDLMYSAYHDPVTVQLFGDVIPLGDIELTKVDAFNASVNGAKFGLYKDAACSDKVTEGTSSGGKIKFADLEPGDYYVKELSAPVGYLIDTKVIKVTVSSNKTAKTSAVNTEPFGKITITKRIDASKTGGKLGDIRVGEAQYTLYAAAKITSANGSHTYYEKDAVIGTRNILPTDAVKGTATWDNLPLGSYYVKETKEPNGTRIDTNVYNITLAYANQTQDIIVNEGTVSIDEVKSQRVKIKKFGTDGNSGLLGGLKGAEFTIKLSADVQNALLNGYSMDDIWKGAADSIAPTYDKLTTNDKGYAISVYLPFGDYIVRETKTPANYAPCADFYFTIENDEIELPVDFRMKELDVNNAPFKSYVKIVKEDATTGKRVTLNSTSFKIRAREDIKDLTSGKVIFKAGDYVSYKVSTNRYDEFMTNSDGLVAANVGGVYATTNDERGTVQTPIKLQAGEYELVEVKEPNGFLIASKAYPFVVAAAADYSRDDDGEPVITVRATNEQPKAELTINKEVVLREGVHKSLIGEIDFTKISFKLSAAKDIIDMTDGTVIYTAGQEIGTYNLGATGSVTISDLWMGEYLVKEVTTNPGAVLDDKEYPVSFTVKDNTTVLYTDALKLQNFTTEIDISKTDITGEKELEGAELVIRDAEGNELDKWVSTSTPHRVEGLEVDKKYTLTENLAPSGYVVASTIEFTLQNTAEIQKVAMVDKQYVSTKVDALTDEALEGAELVVKDMEGNEIDRWITSAEEPHYINNLVEGKTYVLSEVSAPVGFEVAEDIEFTVSNEKETEVVVMKDMPILSSVRVIKCDATTKNPIKSNEFEFSIYSDEKCKEEDLIETSGANKDEGTALFENLRYGTYYIAETQAPIGYSLSDQIVEIVINEEGVFADGEDLAGKDGIYSFEYYDELLPVVKTGDKTIIVFAVLTLIASAGALYFVLRKRKKLNKAGE